MKKVTKYVVVRFYKAKPEHWNSYDFSNFHIYSYESGNKEAIVKYMESLKPKYGKDFQWKVMTKEMAFKAWGDYREWLKGYEKRMLDKKFPSRYIGKTYKEDLAEMMQKR